MSQPEANVPATPDITDELAEAIADLTQAPSPAPPEPNEYHSAFDLKKHKERQAAGKGVIS